jgi:hypothetical protein
MKYIITESQYKTLIGEDDRIEPSKTAIKNICDSEKFCKAQGKITFGQLKALVQEASKHRLYKHVGEGGFKATIRLIPFFLPQLMIPGIIAGAARAINKILKPSLTETESYKTFWGKAILNSFKVVEGEINFDDPFSKIFFISDGLMTMLNDKYKVKFARHIADLADNMPDNEEVPEYFVENELRKWINDKFLLDPPIPSKTFNRKLLPKDIDDTDETLTEQKLSKKELFQDMVNEKLEYIKKRCVDADDVTFPNDISFSTCDTVDLVDSITVAELNVMSSARTDMSGELYNVTPSIYIKLIINFSSAKKIFDFDDLVYDIKHMLRKSTGGLMVVFDYTVNNTFKD